MGSHGSCTFKFHLFFFECILRGNCFHYHLLLIEAMIHIKGPLQDYSEVCSGSSDSSA